ncbi:MAG: MGMT family protein [Deltaproteobacteria bacterium]|nr:MGMT family protein [Deltaproteobacteria bacterium]
MTTHQGKTDRNDRIYAVIREIPPGCVLTYGQVAMLAEIPRGHRLVAAALRGSGALLRLPWQRVVAKHSRKKGRIATKGDDATEQRALLVREGVSVDPAGLISLEAHGWLPID